MDSLDDSYIDRLRDVRREENALVEKLIEERMHLADTIRIDPLTGLYNRRILPKVREVGTVIMCDIDNFKTINDTFGHDVGDEVIKSVATIFLNSIRIWDVAVRFGGDEFLIIFTTNLHEVIEKRMNDVCDMVRNTINLPNHNVSLSVGVTFNDNNEDLDTLMKKADEALYYSKENGKNQITYYEKLKTLKREK